MAWVLVRYRFPGPAAVDALVDLPFALPTAVAGIALTTLYAPNGWLGAPLDALGIKVAFTPLGITLALTFIGLPFVVRTLQPVLESLDPEVEEAAASLGASRLADVLRAWCCPRCFPAWLTGFALAFARALGEYGSVVFIAGNMPMKTEITPLLIITKLEQYDYAGATAIAAVMLVASFVLLLAINRLQSWSGAAGDGGLAWPHRSPLRPRAPSPPAPPSEPLAGEGAPDRGGRSRFLGAVPGACRSSPSSRRRSRRAGPPTSRRSREPMALAALQLTLLTAAVAVPAEPGLRRGRGLGHREVRLPGQERAHHADRPALRGLAGDLRA